MVLIVPYMENAIICGDVLAVIPTLPNASINLVATSPPYAMQRKGLYAGVKEADYPAWTVGWMNAMKPKLTADASIFLNIREHVRDGCISDYVLRTRLALREAGWHEIDELIWYAPDKPPLGSPIRPRRTWERLLWFSPSKRPFVDLYAVNREAGTSSKTDDRGIRTNNRRGDDPAAFKTRRANGQTGGKRTKADCVSLGHGLRKINPFPRVTDLVRVTIGSIDPHVEHPAMQPRGVPSFLIQTFSKPNDLVCDPFSGSGQTCIEAKLLGRRYLGIDLSADYCDLARRRIAEGLPVKQKRAKPSTKKKQQLDEDRYYQTDVFPEADAA